MTIDAKTLGRPDTSGGASTRVPRLTWAEVVALSSLVAIGTVARMHGFTGLDVWFDDAWAAAPARVGLSSAVHMFLTAPGYGLALRSWIRLDPATTWFAQLPAFVLGLTAIPAMFALLRFFRSPRWVAVSGAAIVAVGPLLVQYSARLKEYPFDFLAACVVLWLAERVRRTPSSGALGALALSSVAVFFVSAGTVPVLVGAWLALCVAVPADRAARKRLIVALLGVALGCATVWAALLRHLPHVLTANWRRRGFLVDYGSLGALERSITLVFGGFVHAALAVPVPVTFFNTAPGFHSAGVALLGIMVLGVAAGYPIASSISRSAAVPSLGAGLTLLAAVALAFLDRVPLGDGRTDEVLYPALLVGLAAAVVAVAGRLGGRVHLTRAARLTLAAVALAGAIVFGASHRAVYPTVSLRGVAAQLAPLERGGDVVFVDTFNSFGWCYYELSLCHTRVGGHPVWPQGFRPVSTSPSTFIASHYRVPLPEFTVAQARARRIWYVGFTYGTFDVGTDPARYNLPVATWFTGLLARDGWRPALAGPSTQVLGTHAYAILYVRAG